MKIVYNIIYVLSLIKLNYERCNIIIVIDLTRLDRSSQVSTKLTPLREIKVKYKMSSRVFKRGRRHSADLPKASDVAHEAVYLLSGLLGLVRYMLPERTFAVSGRKGTRLIPI